MAILRPLTLPFVAGGFGQANAGFAAAKPAGFGGGFTAGGFGQQAASVGGGFGAASSAGAFGRELPDGLVL